MLNLVKLIISEMLWVVLHFMYIFPLKMNRVMFNSYMGRQYSCNPRYITEYLLKYYGDKIEIIWSFNEPNNYMDLVKKGIKTCKTRSIKFYYYRLTSHVSICNGTMGAEIPKRKGQYFINTWHGGGGGYKKMGSDVKQQKGFYGVRSRQEKRLLDLFCASSQTMIDNTINHAFHHKGAVFKGTPRNDIFINMDRDDIRAAVYQHFKIKDDIHIALYAPTFRELNDRNKSTHDYGLNYEKLHNALITKFGGKWVIIIRYHYYIKDYVLPELDYVVDATKYRDIQDLLYASDVMITDYSSSIWDYSFTKKPCFLFCADLEQYIAERGFNKPIETWGFPIAQTNKELEQNILSWNKEEYSEAMDRHHQENGSFEDGTATKRLCKIINDICSK